MHDSTLPDSSDSLDEHEERPGRRVFVRTGITAFGACYAGAHHPRAGAGSARIAVQFVGVSCLTANGTPTARRQFAPEIGPFT